MTNTPNEFEVREAWQKFLLMPEARDWYHSWRNAGLVQAEVLAGDLPYTSNALLLAFRKLKDALDKPEPTPKPSEAPIAVADVREEESERERELFAEFERGLPGMNSLQRLQYAVRMKDEYMKKKYPRAIPSTNVHPDTIRNTKAEQKFVRQQQEAYRNQPKFVVHQD
jgi:hypothetical protein